MNGQNSTVIPFFGNIMNKQTVQVLYANLFYCYKLTVLYGPFQHLVFKSLVWSGF